MKGINNIINRDIKLAIERRKYTTKCKCGHSIVFSVQTERTICSWCGYYCYRTPELEFKYKLKGMIK